MATLRRRKERGNRWMLTYSDIDSQQYRIDTGTTEKRIALLWLRKVEELLSKAKLGLIPPVGRIDAGVLAGQKAVAQSPKISEFRGKHDQFCRDELDLSESTLSLNILAFRTLEQALGDILIGEIKKEDVEVWKNQEGIDDSERRSDTTMAIYHRHLKAAFNREIDGFKLVENPFEKVKINQKKRNNSSGEDSKNMSPEEVKILLNAIEKEGDALFGIYIRFLLYTGCRRNEILHLKQTDIDLNRRCLRVYAQKQNKHMQVPINDALLRVVDQMQPLPEGYLFPSQSKRLGKDKGKRPWSDSFVSHKFKKYIRQLGLPEHYHLHSLRHTYSTHLLSQGVPAEIVHKLMGHSSAQVTLQNYDHSIALNFRDQANLVDFEQEN